ncbi:hypothetical protein ACRYCC_23480 [Actinomadura scrupuli]|uniref:hypothetical protein n=1 Tax=Actinomadura scrupuli TaxID=559629 RepID=UPI003D989CB3
MFDAVPVSGLMDRVGPLSAPAEEDLVPVLPALRPVLPGGGLRPGTVVCVDGPGAGSLGLALIAGACRDPLAPGGGWCAAVGLPELGVLAATGMGADPARLLLVDEPGDRWPDVLATLFEAVGLVLVRPPHRLAPGVSRRLTALARRHGCVLAVAGDWAGAQLRLRADTSEWTGLGDGHGQLTGRRTRVVAEGRGAAAQGRDTWIWLPGPDGLVTPAAPPATRPTHLDVVA